MLPYTAIDLLRVMDHELGIIPERRTKTTGTPGIRARIRQGVASATFAPH